MRRLIALALPIIAVMLPVAPSEVAVATPARPMWVPRTARVVFEDTFSSSGIDPARWTTCYPWANASTGCTNPGNKEQEWYLPSQARTSGGALQLVAERSATLGTVNGVTSTYAYRSGMVASARRFEFTYGFVEFRARIPRGQAMWPALWLLPNDFSWPPEIDVMEAVGQAPTGVALTLHGTDGTRPQQLFPGPDFSASWHTFGIAWSSTKLTWFVDGVARFSVDHGLPHKPMYLLADLAVGGTGGGLITADTPAAASFALDYVRVWQR